MTCQVCSQSYQITKSPNLKITFSILDLFVEITFQAIKDTIMSGLNVPLLHSETCFRVLF